MSASPSTLAWPERYDWGRERDAMTFDARTSGQRFSLAVLAGIGLWAAPLPAQAHIELRWPPGRYDPGLQKDDPCGHPDNPPGEDPPAVLSVGQDLTIEFDEFVEHTGYFRVALDPTGTDNFVSPMAFDDFYNSPEVILDDIPDDQEGGLHTVTITLPDEPCDPCTLQLIQVMTDDGAFGPGNDDLYFQCADIVLQLDGGTTGGGNDSGGNDSGNGSTDGPGDDSGTPPGDGGFESSAEGGVGSGSETTAPSDTGEDGGCSCRAEPAPVEGLPWLCFALAIGRRRP